MNSRSSWAPTHTHRPLAPGSVVAESNSRHKLALANSIYTHLYNCATIPNDNNNNNPKQN